MGRSQAHRTVRRTYLAVLILVSVTALLLPTRWHGKLISLVQVIVPFQHAASIAADSVDRAVTSDKPAVSSEVHEVVEQRNAVLRRQVAALAVRVAELGGEVDILTAARLWNVEGQRIGAHGSLIPAAIITEDLLPWRSSRLINAGSLQGVRRGSPVTSRSLVFDPDDGDRAGDGMAVLLGEALIGWVEQQGTHVARVKLISDVNVEMKVRVGRLTDDGFTPLDTYFWLAGRGNGVMEICDAKRRDVEAGLIQVGDIVLSDPTSEILPSAMTIGKVTAIAPNHDNPLLSTLTVRGDVDLGSLRRVYVFVPGEE